MTKEVDLLEKKETFWVDGPLQKRLASIPKMEKSTVIRMALRDYFNLTDSKRGVVGYDETTIGNQGGVNIGETKRDRGSQG